MKDANLYSTAQKKILLDLAKKSIEQGILTYRPLSVKVSDYDSELQQKRATFTTLYKEEELRGCIGVLEAYRPLVQDVVETAFSAAFKDPRFDPVTQDELAEIKISLSVLTPAKPMTFTSEQDLLRQIQPGIDGLILKEGRHQGTFLPSVWESVETAKEFLEHLKMKAGLKAGYWSDKIEVLRYFAEKIE